MSRNLQEAVRKAEWRARNLGGDLAILAASVRSAPPNAVASDDEKHQRRDFLDALYGSAGDAEKAYERIIVGNELQDASYLVRGAIAARAVLRIVLRGPSGAPIGYGTGFLIGDGVLLTNHHVIEGQETARNAEAEAFYERSAMGDDLTPWRFRLQPEVLFYTSEALDFTLVAVSERDRSGAFSRSALGWLPLLGQPGKALEGEWLTIIQHPEGERKQICVRENQLIKRDTDVLWYSTDTLGGSSGSPVFNNDWLVVALHHAGQPETRNGKWQTVDARDYNPATDGEDRIKWIANEGIRASRIVETLRADPKIATHRLVAPIVATEVQDVDVRLPVRFTAGQVLPNLLAPDAPGMPTVPPLTAMVTASASSGGGPLAAAVAMPRQFHPNQHQSDPGETSMAKHLTLNLLVDDDGTVSLLQGGATEAALLSGESAAAKVKKNVIDAPVNPQDDWAKAKGYRPDFLGTGDLRVNLPKVSQTQLIAPLRNAYGETFSDAERAAGVLNYDGYSVVMNKERRFAIFSAANVSWNMRPGITGRTDQWLYDDRIDRAHQIDNSYYRSNKFDRGHLTRREDMEWGDNPIEAVRRANGTCTWTNCTPQHSIFNQDKSPDPAVHLWQGLERYILEERVEQGQFSAQVITGPVFGVGDPVYRDIAYPLEFWKVVVAIAQGGTLFATAYVLSQKAVIDQFGLEVAPVEPFGAYATYQRPISAIEDLAGLQFTYGNDKPLRDLDPLATARGRTQSGRRRVATTEAFGSSGDDALTRFEDIVLF
ncbi:endonuclease G [Rhizobium sp. BK650]|uniref:DNA/RNA non-specific endonuclease n=1 Tax=Rhizobium sp. BK650 TaxID=2586990 RepID=UPI00160A109B|nr:DNA/RNA non-specific endonuclease [Rhizobium sp. BK650]MBB3658527.1 endonuclease G [Rhizobium sp. BK650]